MIRSFCEVGFSGQQNFFCESAPNCFLQNLLARQFRDAKLKGHKLELFYSIETHQPFTITYPTNQSLFEAYTINKTKNIKEKCVPSSHFFHDFVINSKSNTFKKLERKLFTVLLKYMNAKWILLESLRKTQNETKNTTNHWLQMYSIRFQRFQKTFWKLPLHLMFYRKLLKNLLKLKKAVFRFSY